MATQADMLHEQSMSFTGKVGDLIAQHAESFARIQDLNYERDKNLVTMQQAMGVREVSVKTTPGGPTSPGGGV